MRKFVFIAMAIALGAAIFAVPGIAVGQAGSRSFGKTADGVEATLYTLRNKHGLEAAVTNFGATLVSLKTPDRQGKLADIVLGYEDVSGYEAGKVYFGGTIGRYGNRIAEGKFTLDGVTYSLATNNGANHLHGGVRGFNKVMWQAKPLSRQSLELTYRSKGGEEGYPGTLDVKVTYTLTDSDELRIDYLAQLAPGKDTVVNLTNHSYFNLTGNPQNLILQHQVTLYASRFTPVDANLIPTGELRPVAGTPFDFTKATAIGARIDEPDEQLKLGKGYDHNLVIDRAKGNGLAKAAEVFDPSSGRELMIYTTEPGVQFYSGNYLDGTDHGKGGHIYAARSGFCLETQHFPDSPNHPAFPTTTLKAGQRYRSTTVLRFSAR